jgi:metal-responsive CopG/Arc/MetJ family transcriptional regulator
MKQAQRAIINISLPQSFAEEINKTAKVENKTVSELLREAWREHKFSKDWSQIRRLGDDTAKRMGIESYYDIEKITG